VINTSFRRLFELYIFAYVFLLASKPLDDPDFWFHLKTGEYIVGNGLIPKIDPFSFTFNGYPWVAHGWLAGLIFYLVQSRFGYGALIFLFALLITLACWFVFLRCRAHPFITAFAIVLGVLSMSPNIGVRPRVFTILFASVFLFILENYARRGEGKAIWILVPLMALWVNLHGGFVIGVALIVLTIIGLVLDKWLGDDQTGLRPRLVTLAVVLGACLLTTAVNPYGTQMFAVPLRVLQTPVYKQLVVDWLSPDFHRPEVFPFLLLLLLTAAALALSPVRPKLRELLLLLATLYATLTSQRNMAVFALVAVPLLANYSQHWLDSIPLGKFFGKTSLIERRANVLAILFLLPLVLFAIQLKATVYGDVRQQTMDVPVTAVEYLKQNQITGNTFTDPNIWANYVIWALPSNPVFIDGRDVYPEAFVDEYARIVLGLADWREPFERYGVRVVIVAPKSVIARQMKSASEWQEVYQDEMAIVFSKRSPNP
jgi:hypothetical protein